MKYRRDYASAQLFGHALALFICSAFADAPTALALIPIPSSRRRLRERGYDHTRFFVTSAIKSLKYRASSPAVFYHPRFLTKKLHTAPQSLSASRGERLARKIVFTVDTEALAEIRSSAAALTHSDKQYQNHITYLIIDDVITTGATTYAAQKAIEPHLIAGECIAIVCLAH
jgi:predicted amidophosphoribosyltransferase